MLIFFLCTPPLNPKLMLPKVPFAPFWILIRGPHERPDFKFQVIMLGEIAFFAFFVFFCVFSLSPAKYGCFRVFSAHFCHQK